MNDDSIAIGVRPARWVAFFLVSLIAAQQPPLQPAERERTLLFVGDVMLSRGVESKMKSEDDWAYPFRRITPTLAAADLAFGNLECPVSDVGHDLRHRYSFRADPKVLEGLKAAGFRVMSVANNHTDDWDRPALLDTLRRLREAGIRPVGAGENDLEAHYPAVVNVDDVRLAFLAYVGIEPKDATAKMERPGVAWLEAGRAAADIRFARPLADLVIVSVHWGVEYATRPRPEQVALAHRMIDAGADVVIGHHPHVTQPIDNYGKGWIAYSLGNFVFDQKTPAGTHHGLILKVTLRGRKIAEVSSIPVTIDSSYQVGLTPPLPLRQTARRAAPKDTGERRR